MKHWIGLGLAWILLLGVSVVSAQDDEDESGVLTIGTTIEITMEGDGDGRLFTFEGTAGDVVYVTGVDESGSDADILFEIYGPNGRLTGLVSDPPFDPFTVAELPETGTYSLIMSHDSFGEETYTVTLGRSGVLGPQPLTADFSVLGPPVVFLMRPDDDGPYTLSFRGDPNETQPLVVTVRDFTVSETGREIIDFQAHDGRFLLLTTGFDGGHIYAVTVRGARTSNPDLIGLRMTFDARLQRAE